MSPFELSERWSPWSDIAGIFCAASAAIDFGPLDPVVCEVVFNEEFDPFTVDTLEQAWEDLEGNPNMMSMDITLSHIDADAARVTLSYSGRRLLLSGHGSDWDRAKAAYDAAQGVLSSRQSNAVADTPAVPNAVADTPAVPNAVAYTPAVPETRGTTRLRTSTPRITEYQVRPYNPSIVRPAPPRYQPAEDVYGEPPSPQYSDDDPPTWKDFLKAANKARKMLKDL
jgi:hypothetical protein